jgi:hypothetical protein
MKAILQKIEDLLTSRKRYWYGEKNINFRYQSHYVEFDEMLKREVCYADYASEGKLISCTGRLSASVCEMAFEKIPLVSSGTTFFEYLVSMGLCKVDAPLNKKGILFIAGHKVDAEFVIQNNVLESIIIYNLEVCAILIADPPVLQQWIEKNIRLWLSHELGLKVTGDWLQKDAGITVVVEAFVPVSSVEVEMSTESDADVVRWREKLLDSQCVGYNEIDITEAYTILNENGIKLPSNADQTGWYRNEYGGNTNTFIFRCEHRIPDTTTAYLEDLQMHSSGFSSLYLHPGSITVENDFFQCTIDTKNRIVTSTHQKWQSEDNLRRIVND